MKQRTSFKIIVEVDILQEMPNESTHQDVTSELDNFQLTIERELVKTLTEDYGGYSRCIVTKLPIFS